MRRFRWLLAVVLFGSAVLYGAFRLDVSVPSDRDLAAATAVRVDCDHDTWGCYGSGAIVSGDSVAARVLTNFHVVDGALAIRVVRGGATFAAHVTDEDCESDLAVVTIHPGVQLPTLPIAKAKAVVGQPVLISAFRERRETFGSLVKYCDWTRVILEGHGAPGTSGSAYISRGALVGVHRASDYDANEAFGVGLRPVRQILDSQIECKGDS